MGFLLVHVLTGLAGASSLFLVASGADGDLRRRPRGEFRPWSLTMLGAYAGWIILTHLPRDPAWFALGVLGTAAAALSLARIVPVAGDVWRRVDGAGRGAGDLGTG
jgi:branched-chain amino acid transport system permease protein